MKRNYLFYILISLVLIGCKSTPSDQDVFGLLQEKHSSSNLSKVSDISNIKKTNGFEESENTYIVDVEYDLTTNMDLKEFESILEKQFRTEAKGLRGREKWEVKSKIAIENNDIFIAFKKFDKGVVKNYKEKISLINTEQGWKIKES